MGNEDVYKRQVLVIATIIQMIVLKLKYGVIEKQQKIMAIAVVFFGLLTAYFNEIKYLQWKVTIINALFAICLLYTSNDQGILVNWNERQVQLTDTQEPIQIRFAYTGKVKRQHNRPADIMKKIWQELGVPPWQRNRIPLIFYGETLQSAVGFFRVFQNEEK